MPVNYASELNEICFIIGIINHMTIFSFLFESKLKTLNVNQGITQSSFLLPCETFPNFMNFPTIIHSSHIPFQTQTQTYNWVLLIYTFIHTRKSQTNDVHFTLFINDSTIWFVFLNHACISRFVNLSTQRMECVQDHTKNQMLGV